MTPRLSLQLALPGQWELVDEVREAVRRLVSSAWGDGELADALSMASAELLENAIKYGVAGGAVDLTLTDEGEELVITVANHIDPDTRYAAQLEACLEWLHGFANPAVAYTEALQRLFAKGDAASGESGLGILRVAYEGGCQVDCDLSAAPRILVRARRKLVGAPR